MPTLASIITALFPRTWAAYGAGAATNRFFPTLGHHDWGFTYPNPTGDQPYLNYFTLPGNGRYYTFTQGPVQFFALDSDGNEPDGITSTSTQALWLQAQLAASTATYKIVYMYEPPYSSSAGFETPADALALPGLGRHRGDQRPHAQLRAAASSTTSPTLWTASADKA